MIKEQTKYEKKAKRNRKKKKINGERAKYEKKEKSGKKQK